MQIRRAVSESLTRWNASMIDRALLLLVVPTVLLFGGPDEYSDPALQPPPVLTTPGAKYKDINRKFQSIPGISRMSILHDSFVSDDDGRRWTSGLLLDERMNVSYPDGVQGTTALFAWRTIANALRRART